jgi:hypothetical protein
MPNLPDRASSIFSYIDHTLEAWLLWDSFCEISLCMRVRQNLFSFFFNIPDIVKVLKSKNSQGRNRKKIFLSEENRK